MRRSQTSRLVNTMGGALVVLFVWAAWPALAQTAEPQQTPPAAEAPGAVPDGDEAEAKPPQIAETIPDSATERAKMLDNLYALLATAEDEQASQKTSLAIVRLWAVSGSDTVTVLMARALKAVEDKNPALALQMFDAIVEQAPDYAEGWSQRAHVLYLEGDVERAVGDLRRSLALDPNHYRALGALGHILREIGEKKGALTAYQRLLEVHPFAEGAKQAVEDLEREIGGQGI